MKTSRFYGPTFQTRKTEAKGTRTLLGHAGGKTATFPKYRCVRRGRRARLRQPREDARGILLPPHAPCCGPGAGKEKEAPGRAWKEREARPQPARPYLGCTARPRRARGPEAPAGAARPRPARGRPRLRPPSRPAALPPSAAPGGSAVCPRKRPRGVAPGPGLGLGHMRGAPRASLDRLGEAQIPRSRPGPGAGGAGQGAIFSESCSPSWADRTS